MSRFAPLLSVELRHPYYQGAWQDLQFVWPAETGARLRGGRLVAKVTGARLDVQFERGALGDGPLLDSRGKQLRLGLCIRNPYFVNVTTLPGQAVWRNSPNARQLMGVPGEELDPELRLLGAFAQLDVLIAADFYQQPAAFTFEFAVRQEVLRYYLVTRKYSDADLALLTVADAGFEDDQRAEVQFARLSPAEFGAAEVPPSLLGNGESRVLLFRSLAPLPRRERPRRKIQLRKNGEVLIEHLPQPGAERPNADLIVHLSKP